MHVGPSLMRQVASGVGLDIAQDAPEGWQWVKLLCETAVEHWEREEWNKGSWYWARMHSGSAAEYLPSTREAFVAATDVKLWHATVDPPVEDTSDLAEVVYAHLHETGVAIVHAVGKVLAEAEEQHGR